MSDIGDAIGRAVTLLTIISTLLSLSRKGGPLLGFALRAVEKLAEINNTPRLPEANSNGNGYRRAVEEQGKRLDMTGEWVRRVEEKIDELVRKVRVAEDGTLVREEKIRRAISDRFDRNDREFTKAIEEIHAKFASQDEKIDHQGQQLSELLMIARNGNGKHPPESDEQPGDKS